MNRQTEILMTPSEVKRMVASYLLALAKLNVVADKLEKVR